MSHIKPTKEQGVAFMQRGLTGSVEMLNLLRFRETADYTGHEALAPAAPISGRQAYDLYIEHTRPFLEAAGASLSYMAQGGSLVIGPEDERWDLVLIVKHQSVEAFMNFAFDKAYLAGAGHRAAACEDTRLLPMTSPSS